MFEKGDLVVFIDSIADNMAQYINSVGIVFGISDNLVKVLFTETIVGIQIIIVHKKNLKKVLNNT